MFSAPLLTSRLEIPYCFPLQLHNETFCKGSTKQGNEKTVHLRHCVHRVRTVDGKAVGVEGHSEERLVFARKQSP